MECAGGHAGRILVLEVGESVAPLEGPRTDGASDDAGPAASPRDDVADALADAGFTVERTTSVAECLRDLEATAVDGIVAEHAPPAVDGLHLLRSVRVGHPSLPFVLLPRERTDAIAGDAVAAGVSGYVSPKEDAAAVVRRLESCLDPDGPGVDVPRPDDDWPDRYRHLVEISPVPINLFDGDGICIWGNDAVLDMLGLSSRAELVGRSIFEFIHPEDRATARRELTEVTQERRSVGPTEMKLVPEHGDVRHVRIATAIGDLYGATIGQAIVVDVSDRELRQRHLTVLDTWLRHNIRNELNLIEGIAADIEQGRGEHPVTSAGKIRAAADHLVQQADRQRRLIRLLQNPPEPMMLDLGALLERRVAVATDCYPDATVRIDATADASVTVIAEVEGAVGELLENAVEHAEASDPTVVCSIERDAGDAVLRVRDDGPGIPAAERDLLFLEREVDQIHHGSGLGLVFVYWAVRFSDGRLDFEVDETGTTVTVRLPLDGGQ